MPKREISLLLIVQDSNLQERLENALEGRYRLKTVTNLENGLAMAFSSVPDIIIIQSDMPKERLMTTGKAIRENQLTSHIPIILILDDNLIRAQSNFYFADVILVFSFSKKEMITALRNVIAKKIQLMKRYPIFYNSDNAFTREQTFLSNYLEQFLK